LAKKKRQGAPPFTLLIVPHTEYSPISFRVPVGLLYLILALVMAGLVGLFVFVVKYRALQAELSDLRYQQQLGTSRQREMRAIILEQEDQVGKLRAQEEKLSRDLGELDRIAAEVRRIVGLDRNPTPTPRVRPDSTAVLGTAFGPEVLGAMGPSPSWQRPERAALSPSTRGSRTTAPGLAQDLEELSVLMPEKLQEFNLLREQVDERVARVDPDKRSDPAELERQLKLYDAAPRLWPVRGLLTSGFGYRTLLGQRDFHEGIDLGVWWNTPVRATQDGVVVFAGWQPPGLGWTVKIQHEMGFATVYGHNSYNAVKVGERVKAGQVIAYSGDSGKSTGPHVHYEVHLNGAPIDPMKYLEH